MLTRATLYKEPKTKHFSFGKRVSSVPLMLNNLGYRYDSTPPIMSNMNEPKTPTFDKADNNDNDEAILDAKTPIISVPEKEKSNDTAEASETVDLMITAHDPSSPEYDNTFVDLKVISNAYDKDDELYSNSSRESKESLFPPKHRNNGTISQDSFKRQVSTNLNSITLTKRDFSTNFFTNTISTNTEVTIKEQEDEDDNYLEPPKTPEEKIMFSIGPYQTPVSIGKRGLGGVDTALRVAKRRERQQLDSPFRTPPHKTIEGIHKGYQGQSLSSRRTAPSHLSSILITPTKKRSSVSGKYFPSLQK